MDWPEVGGYIVVAHGLQQPLERDAEMGGSACGRGDLVVALALCLATLSLLVASPVAAQTSLPPVAPTSAPASVLAASATQAAHTEAPGRNVSDRGRVERGASPPSLRLPAELCLRKPRRSVERCWDELLVGIPEYQEAIRRRRAGAELIAFGAGGGGGLMVFAAVLAGLENWCLLGACPHPDYAKEKIMAGLGAAILAVGLAVGIPLLVSGTSQRNSIRARYLGAPVVGLGAGPGQGLVSAWWLF